MMNRKAFLSRLAAAATGLSGLLWPGTAQSKPTAEPDNYLPFLPIKTENKMNTVLHPAATRGHANHGWLDSRHTFSFAHYYDPARMHFGVLRVLNDDWVDGGKGFGTHPHDNMEIISIPLVGDLEHQDSMGNRTVIRQHDVQIMSAGTGISHSEYNHNTDRKVNFLQIWVFPQKRNIKPRYDQKTFRPEDRANRLHVVVNPMGSGTGVEINQNAWFSLGSLKAGFETDYQIRQKGNGAYIFVIGGQVTIGEQKLDTRDGYGIWNTDSFRLTAKSDAEVLVMDVPMS